MSYFEVNVYYGGSMSDWVDKIICDKIDVDNGFVIITNEYDPKNLDWIINKEVILSPHYYAKISYNEIGDDTMDRLRKQKVLDKGRI